MSLAVSKSGLFPGNTESSGRMGGFRGGWWVAIRQLISQYGLPRTLWALVVGLPKSKAVRLKPTGYNAFIERITQPMLVVASIALTTGAVFVMAQGLIQQASNAIAARQIPSFQIILALGTLFVIGFLIDTSLITAGSRFRMHALRGEVGWALLSCAMLLLCVGVEGMTWSYLLYELEPTVLPENVAAFIRGIPAVLFFVRAFMGPLCLIYLTAGVLPLTIQRGDVDRQVSSVTGSAIVTVVTTLARQVLEYGLVSAQQGVILLDLLFTLFRVAAKHETEQQDKAMVQAFRDLSDSIASTAIAPALEQIAQFTPQTGDQAEQWNGMMAQLSGLIHEFAGQSQFREQAHVHLDSNASLTAVPEYGMDDGIGQNDAGSAVGAGEDQAAIRDKMPVASYEILANGTDRNSTRVSPRPGTKVFRAAVRRSILALQRAGQPLTFYTVARAMGDDVQPDDVKAAFEEMRQERMNKLRPGSRLAADPVLDEPALLVTAQ